MSLTIRFQFIGKFALLCAVLFTAACGKPLEYQLTTKVNPSGIAPLTAQINIMADQPCTVAIEVEGKSPMVQAFDTKSNELYVPVVGLYPNRTNQVKVTLTYDGGQAEEVVEITTDPLPASFPSIEIDKINRKKMEPGMHLCDLHFANDGVFYSYPMIFDDQGEVRWYLDLSFFQDIMWPIQRLSDGVLLVVGKNEIYEFDMMGKAIKRTVLSEKLRLHHEVLELPGGQLLIPVDHADARIQIDGELYRAFNDMMLLFDRKATKVVRYWDLSRFLDVDRGNINFMTQSDWIHLNGLAFDPSDSTIIASCKNQGVIKIHWKDEVNWSQQLEWIMAPKLNWKKTGRFEDGFNPNSFLLTAVNSEGVPYPDSVQLGYVSPEDFDFPWGQHAPELLDNGNLLMFDNGFARNYTNPNFYSRAVEYKIDEENRTVQQVWQYGKERGDEFFSTLISDVDKLPNTGNILITSGHIKGNSKITEVTYPEGEEVFEATLTFKTLNGTGAFEWGQLDVLYRSERFELRY